MNKRQKQLFDRIVDTQYSWLSLRGIIQNEFVAECPYPSEGEIAEWEENIDRAINELVSIKFDVLDYIHDIKQGRADL